MTPRRWQLLIGWSELIIGVGGVLMLPFAASHNAIQASSVYYLVAGVVFAFAGVVGWLLVRGNQFGLQATRWLQVAQFLQLTAAGFTYQFTVGLQLLLVFGPGHFHFSPGFNAGLWIGPSIGDQAFRFGVNLFPLIAFWALRSSEPIAAPPTAAEASAEGTA
jgi:hypothetical protein